MWDDFKVAFNVTAILTLFFWSGYYIQGIFDKAFVIAPLLMFCSAFWARILPKIWQEIFNITREIEG